MQTTAMCLYVHVCYYRLCGVEIWMSSKKRLNSRESTLIIILFVHVYLECELFFEKRCSEFQPQFSLEFFFSVFCDFYPTVSNETLHFMHTAAVIKIVEFGHAFHLIAE